MKHFAVGMLLFTQNYDECIDFYRNKLKLDVIFEEEMLVNFRFGQGYLMVERGGEGAVDKKGFYRNPSVIRFDVEDLDASAAELIEQGIEVEKQSFEWGNIAVFYDPDGNRCELYAAPENGKGNL